MDKIPLKELIAAGAWLDCYVDSYKEEQCKFRLRVVSFERTSVADLEPSLVGEVDVEGILWLLSLEVVNLSKTPMAVYKLHRIKLIDEDEFEFGSHCRLGDLAFNKRLRRFAGFSNDPPLPPKIKVTGSIAFGLPDEDNSYYLAIEAGNVKES